MSFTFEIDAVDRATDRIEEWPAIEAVREVFGPREILMLSDPQLRVAGGARLHPFADAVHRAFSEHRPLVLSPDGVWLTIAQGFAQHVNADPKARRDQLVDFEGTRTVTCGVSRLRTLGDWELAIAGLCERVRAETGTIGELLKNDFSTSTPATRVATDVVLLDSMKRYFRYELRLICGIPEVTLLGTPDDWRKIEGRLDRLNAFDLEWWTEWLRPVCRELRRTAEGKPDLDFWQSIYMPVEIYGGELVPGWIMRFFPYVDLPHQARGGPGAEETVSMFYARNPALAPWRDRDLRIADLETRRPVPMSRRRWLCAGAGLGVLPVGFSTVPVELEGAEDQELGGYQVFAGFLGLTQRDDLALQAEVGWGVAEGGEPLARTRGVG